MSDIIDGVGVLAEGSLTARAVEPRRGEHAAGHSRESACLNCAAPLAGPFCHQCGQQAHLHRTVGAFLHDLLHGVLHFEGKTWRTLPLLAWKPGQLTRDYIDGHRARHVSPMALFLFSVFLMFAVFQAVGISPPVEFNGGQQAAAGIAKAADQVRNARKDAATELAGMAPDDPGRARLEQDIRDLDQQIAAVDEALPTFAQDAGGSFTNIHTGSPFIDHLAEKWQKNPSLMIYKLQANSYKFSWLLIPLSLPFMALLFLWRRRFGLYDHAVFVTYSLAFMTLLFVVITLLAQLGIAADALAIGAMLIPPLHIYRQLRGAYGLRRLSALWRTAVLCGLIGVILLLFLNLLVLLGAF